MPEPNKLDISLLEFIDNVTNNLKQEIDHTHKVVKEYLEGDRGKSNDINYCCLVDCPTRQALRQTLYKAIKVLETTKKSFKSKELENLRKDLEEVLLEAK